MKTAAPGKEPTITWTEVSRRLKALGMSVTYSRFLDLIEKHGVPHTINTLSRRGGGPNRRFWWSIVEPFFMSFQKPVNHDRRKQ